MGKTQRKGAMKVFREYGEKVTAVTFSGNVLKLLAYAPDPQAALEEANSRKEAGEECALHPVIWANPECTARAKKSAGKSGEIWGNLAKSKSGESGENGPSPNYFSSKIVGLRGKINLVKGNLAKRFFAKFKFLILLGF